MRALFQMLGLALVAFFWSLPGMARSQGGGNEQRGPAPSPELPPVPKGIEVLARGPVHEAFATPTAEPLPTPPVSKQPPKPLDEMPPEQKPEGDVVWIGGYWAWDDDRKDFLWVSGVWRTTPPGKSWVAGYWREDADRFQWVPGFWAAAEPHQVHQQVTYLPAPPPPPEVAPPGHPPTAESFFVPGAWVWADGRYAWRAGYWAQVQPGYVWVQAHYRWTPGGYVFIPGYWDLALDRRGVLFAPVVVDVHVVPAAYVYTPAYVVHDAVVVDTLFVRPGHGHYYFGDYYGPAYREIGFESAVIYSRRHYDAIYVYSRWEHRDDPRWETVQLDVALARHAGKAPLPPRTLVQQNTIIQQNITNVNVANNTTNVYRNTVISQAPVLVPASQMATVKKVNTVTLDAAARSQLRQQAQEIQQVARQRSLSEQPASPAGALQPRVATLNVPPAQPAKSAVVPTRSAAPTAQVKPPMPIVPPTPSHAASGPPAGASPLGGPPAPRSTRPPLPGSPVAPATRNGGNAPPSRAPMAQPANRLPPGVPPRPQTPPKPNNTDNPPKPPPANGPGGPPGTLNS
jgi:hypothetical protein